MIPVRVMTYNVRRCTGIDGQVSPERIAKIISAYRPDIVALQEVDVNRRRTNFVNQPERLAELTGTKACFFARVVEGPEQYGIAILSKHPMEIIRADNLPTQYVPPKKESGGAIWVKVKKEHMPFQFMATHFNHHPGERLTHMRALVGAEWLKDSRCQPPFIFCGDLNTTHQSPVYAKVRSVLSDAQAIKGEYTKTWPSLFPLFRIDHIFVSKGIQVQNIEAPSSFTARIASDHLPLIADLSY